MYGSIGGLANLGCVWTPREEKGARLRTRLNLHILGRIGQSNCKWDVRRACIVFVTFWQCFEVHTTLHWPFLEHGPGMFCAHREAVDGGGSKAIQLNLHKNSFAYDEWIFAHLKDSGRANAHFERIQENYVLGTAVGGIPTQLGSVGGWVGHS